MSTLQFSSHAAPLSCAIYNKTREIKQKSGKTFFYDLWRQGFDGPSGGFWDGESDVWGVEFRFKRDFMHQLKQPIEGAYVLLDVLPALWSYAAGLLASGPEGLPDDWLRYIVPDSFYKGNKWQQVPMSRDRFKSLHQDLSSRRAVLARSDVARCDDLVFQVKLLRSGGYRCFLSDCKKGRA